MDKFMLISIICNADISMYLRQQAQYQLNQL